MMSDVFYDRIKSFMKGWGLSLLIAVLIATSFKSTVADWNDIPSGSMQPTILIGDRVFVNKLAYDLKIPYTTFHLARWADPKRGEIVVFYSPEDEKRMIKRVVGLPGDEVSMYQNRLFLNGEALEYEPLTDDEKAKLDSVSNSPYVVFNEKLTDRNHTVMFSRSRPSMNTFGPVVIPEGRYFMMGDNRDNSADSRYFGLVERKAIVGRSTMVVISRDGSFINPRWNRFFSGLN